MKTVLATILSTLQQKPRYISEARFSRSGVLVHDAFRLFEVLFGRRVGIRAEYSQRVSYDNSGLVLVERKFASWEAFLSFIEIEARKYMSNVFTRLRLSVNRYMRGATTILDELSHLPEMLQPEFAFVDASFTRAESKNERSHFNLSVAYVRTAYVNNASTTLDGGSGSNRMIISCAHTTNNSTENLTGVSWNGESFTKCGNSYENDHPSSRFLSMWKLKPTGTGSQTLSFTASPTDYDTYTTLYTGVKDSTLPKNQAYTKGGSSITSLSLSVTAGSTDWLVGCGDNTAATMNAGSNTTIRDAGTPNSWGMVDSNGVSSPTALNISWSSGAYGALMGFAMEPAGADATVDALFFAHFA